VFGSILNRTIFLELLKVFLMSLVGITGLLLLAGVVSEASKEGLAPHQIAAIIPLIIPSTLPYTIPATTLFGTCVIYGRLAADNEILAIKSAGVNVLRVIAPGLFLGLACSAATFALYHSLIPSTHWLMRTLFLNDVENLLYAVLEREGSFRHPRLDYEIDVEKVQGRKLINAEFMHRDATHSRFDIIARAKEAELLWDRNNNKILVHMRFCNIWSDRNDAIYVEDKVYPVDLPPDLVQASKKFRPSDMTWRELLRARRDTLHRIEERTSEIALQVTRLAMSNPPDSLPQHIQNLRVNQKYLEQELRDLDVELQKRPALSFGCLCFVLVGCPVGVWFGRSDYLSAFVTCFLPIIVVYYPLLLCGLNLSRSGGPGMLAGIWAANGMLGLVGLELYRRLLKN
jgi:lipopolysaccharide export system permease protein